MFSFKRFSSFEKSGEYAIPSWYSKQRQFRWCPTCSTPAWTRSYFVIHGWQNGVNAPIDILVRYGILKSYLLFYFGGEGRQQKTSAGTNLCYAATGDKMAYFYYVGYEWAVPYVWNHIGQFIKNIYTFYNYSLDKITLVGHSFGDGWCIVLVSLIYPTIINS